MIPRRIPHFVAIDTETTGLSVYKGHRMFAAAARWDNGKSKVWRDLNHWRQLKQIMADPTIDKVFHNANFDLNMMAASGITEVRGRVWDTMIFAHLLDARDAKGHLNLNDVAKKYLPKQFRKLTTDIDAWFDEHDMKGRDAKNFQNLPHEILKKRVVGDADLTARLFVLMYETVASTFPYLLELEHDILPIVREMGVRGMYVSEDELDVQSDHFGDMVEELRIWCECALNWHWFNVNSRADQLALLETQGVLNQIKTRTKRSKTHPRGQVSLDDFTLRAIYHPAPATILVMRTAAKMRSTYLEGIREQMDSNGVVHANFKQCGTKSGRFSCSDPNLMNMPIDGDRRAVYTVEEQERQFEMTGANFAPHIKRIFHCRPGYVHIHSDKKQAEMAAIAHYADSKMMRDSFEKGESIHDTLTWALYGEHSKGLKTRTKRVVFGYLYGAGLARLALQIGCGMQEAKATRQKLMNAIPELPAWSASLCRDVARQGFVMSIHGRRNYLRPSEDYKAVNRMCQSTVADEIKSRMRAIDRVCKEGGFDARIILNVHDDIATECAVDQIDEFIPLMFKAMCETDMPFNLPLPADCSITYTRWADTMNIKDPYDPSSFPRKEDFVAKPDVLDMRDL